MSDIVRNAKGQFEKGTPSPNPKGRPKGTISSIMKEFMYDVDDNGFSKIEHLFYILWDKAIKGDLAAIKMIMDRVDGTPRQTVKTVSDMKPIKILEIEDA